MSRDFMDFVDPEKLESISTDKRIENVNYTLSEDEMNVEREKYYIVDSEITQRNQLISNTKAFFNQNIEPAFLADKLHNMISESKKLSDSGLKKLIKDKEELSLIIETGKRKSEEEVFVVTKKTLKKSAFYSLNGYLIEVRDLESRDLNLFNQED